jgi:ABC-type oligopeptide transport system substrate-binding subunit
MRGLLFLLACLVAGPSSAAYAYAQFGDIKYPPGFTHFDYVNPNAPKGGEIRMVPPTRPSNFDKFNPFTLKGNAPYDIDLLFDSLLVGNSDEPTTAYGLLAEDVEVAPDRLSATFRLNPKARFHDGKPVLAADVVHSFKTLISEEAAPQFRTIYAEVKDATAVAERTVRFDFSSPNPELPLVVGGMSVFSREWGKGKPFDEVVSEIPIGSGPYRIANPRMGRDITYVRDPNYWAADLPTRKGQFNFDRITFKIYLDETSRFEGLKAGEFDFMREFISRNWARQYKGKHFNSGELAKRAFENRNPGDFQGYIFNLRKPKFQDIRVRKAIGLAMDFEWMNKQLFYGEAFTMEFLNDQPSLIRIVGPFQKALEKLGVQLIYRVVDFSLSKQKMDAFDFEVTTLRLPGRTAPGGELLELFGSKAAATPGSSNVWGIADPAVDALLQKVVTARTRPELSAAMRALDRVLSHGYYSVPQYYGDAFLVGYRPRPFVLPPRIPPYYQVDSWALSTWWASPENR